MTCDIQRSDLETKRLATDEAIEAERAAVIATDAAMDEEVAAYRSLRECERSSPPPPAG